MNAVLIVTSKSFAHEHFMFKSGLSDGSNQDFKYGKTQQLIGKLENPAETVPHIMCVIQWTKNPRNL